MEVTEFATIRELISRGLGMGLLPRAHRTLDGLVEVPLSGATYCRDIALARGSSTQAPATDRLSRFLLRGFGHAPGGRASRPSR